MRTLAFFVASIAATMSQAEDLFQGKSLDKFQFAENAWYVDSEASLTCRMQEVKQKNGTTKLRGMGYIWTREKYQDFELSLSYKLSEAANSGVFFRTDKSNPVQGGFEIQLLDEGGFQKLKGKKDPKNLNAAFYDCQAAKKHKQNPLGQWNTFKLTCQGTKIAISINGHIVNEADIAN
ncbi:MAG: DUF1080 domain-containing protein, partial [Planctomycetota bacterium]